MENTKGYTILSINENKCDELKAWKELYLHSEGSRFKECIAQEAGTTVKTVSYSGENLTSRLVVTVAYMQVYVLN